MQKLSNVVIFSEKKICRRHGTAKVTSLTSDMFNIHSCYTHTGQKNCHSCSEANWLSYQQDKYFVQNIYQPFTCIKNLALCPTRSTGCWVSACESQFCKLYSMMWSYCSSNSSYQNNEYILNFVTFLASFWSQTHIKIPWYLGALQALPQFIS